MPRIYKLSRSGLKLIYKIRHHKGHGIHSPFVFNFINRVIEEKNLYYAYDNIAAFVNEMSEEKLVLDKNNLLLFRIVNYMESKKIVEFGSGKGLNTLCLTAPASAIKCISVEKSESQYNVARMLYQNWNRDIVLHTDTLPHVTEKQDCICIDLNNYGEINAQFIEYLSAICDEQTCIIVNNIRADKKNHDKWKMIAADQSRTAMLDLFNMGILFFDKKLYRWDYQISF